MGGINVGRWLASGFAASVVVFIVEGMASVFYMEEMETSLEALGLAMEMSTSGWILAILASLIVGMAIMFFYVAARPRFGPGPKTAILAAMVIWVCGNFLALIGYQMIGIYPTSMLVMWGGIGLVEINLAALVGGWIYQEEEVSG